MSTEPSSSNTYSLPTTLHSTPRNSWKQRLNILKPASTSNSPNDVQIDSNNTLNRAPTGTSAKSNHVPKWYKVRLFRGMINDFRRRAPFYWSDWTDAWDYRVVPATVYMYFAKFVYSSIYNTKSWPVSSILPALAFSLDMWVFSI